MIQLATRLSLAIALCAVFCAGCGREAGPPPPLAAENIPAEFARGFAKAKPPVKELASLVVSTLGAKDYPAAYAAVQNLCAAPDATKAEKELSARALLTVTALLQTAQAQGDETAAQVLRAQKKFK